MTTKKVGLVSLGCPKALVDSERIVTGLQANGYEVAPSYDDADVVVVNTCGFLDSAKQESLDAIGEAMAENGRVVVTGCMGGDEDIIRALHPDVLAVSGPHQYDAVIDAVRAAVPATTLRNAVRMPVPGTGARLTPSHYAYLKISEGCNHRCSFCIIPDIRGDLVSRPIDEVLREAENLAAEGVRELLVISQDTSAYGQDLRHAGAPWRDREYRTHMIDLCRGLADLDVWTRLHYVYPYPYVDQVIPLMAEGLVLPYLDIPFQHSHPDVLAAMKRPAHGEQVLERITNWRRDCPDLALRSTFIVGFPGETEAQFEHLLEWLWEARLDRVGCFKYEAVAGARANARGGAVREEEKQIRWERLMENQQQISEAVMAERVGNTMAVIIDAVDDSGARGRSHADAPEIDGVVYLDGETDLAPGDMVAVTINKTDAYDMWGSVLK